MTALDFVMYSLGTSLMILSIAGAIRLNRRAPRSKREEVERRPTQEDRQDVLKDRPDDELGARLRNLQAARFASPIVQRQLDPQLVPTRIGTRVKPKE